MSSIRAFLCKRLATSVINISDQAGLQFSIRRFIGLMPDQNREIHVDPRKLEKKSKAEDKIEHFAEHNRESLTHDLDELTKIVQAAKEHNTAINPAVNSDYVSKLEKKIEKTPEKTSPNTAANSDYAAKLAHDIAENPAKAAQNTINRIWSAGDDPKKS